MTTLEDTFADVVTKAMRGTGIDEAELAARTGVTAEAVRGVREERYDADTLRKIAPVLGLNAEALAELPRYCPALAELDALELACFATLYGTMEVHSYLVWDAASKSAAAFDTGGDCGPMLQFLRNERLTLRWIFLTHAHSDHRADVARLQAETGAEVCLNRLEPAHAELAQARRFTAGERFPLGRCEIETRLTCGHTPGGTSYLARGLARGVVMVGDALFAGSMGGGLASYADALRTNREQLFTLPSETLVCPGHGPLTTIGEERAHNPFFA